MAALVPTFTHSNTPRSAYIINEHTNPCADTNSLTDTNKDAYSCADADSLTDTNKDAHSGADTDSLT